MKDVEEYRDHDTETLNALNEKKVGTLSDSLQRMIRYLFPECNEEDVLHGGLCERYEKPDIYLEARGLRQYVSLKDGKRPSLHVEKLREVLLFLRELGLSTRGQKTLLFYLHGDGTLDGNGPHRFDSQTMLGKIKEDIHALNQELNAPRFLRKGIGRFVFEGSKKRETRAGFLAYGNPREGFDMVSRYELEAFLMRQKPVVLNVPHIGPFVLSPWIRNIEKDPDVEWKRDFVRVHYPNLRRDLRSIAMKRDREGS